MLSVIDPYSHSKTTSIAQSNFTSIKPLRKIGKIFKDFVIDLLLNEPPELEIGKPHQNSSNYDSRSSVRLENWTPDSSRRTAIFD